MAQVPPTSRSGAPSGTAGGDLTGTYPNPTVGFLNGVAVNNTPATGQVFTAIDGSNASWQAQEKTIELKVFDDASALATGDGKIIAAIPLALNGYNLTAVAAFVTTVSSSGLPTVQIRNVTQAADMLSTRVTIDVSEFTSYTALAPPVIDAANDDVATGDLIAVDVDVAGTGAKGLGVILTFTRP